jgi:hypothetical protein
LNKKEIHHFNAFVFQVKKHPDVISKGKRMYLNDLLEDPVVRIQKKLIIKINYINQ